MITVTLVNTTSNQPIQRLIHQCTINIGLLKTAEQRLSLALEGDRAANLITQDFKVLPSHQGT